MTGFLHVISTDTINDVKSLSIIVIEDNLIDSNGTKIGWSEPKIRWNEPKNAKMSQKLVQMKQKLVQLEQKPTFSKVLCEKCAKCLDKNSKNHPNLSTNENIYHTVHCRW